MELQIWEDSLLMTLLHDSLLLTSSNFYDCAGYDWSLCITNTTASEQPNRVQCQAGIVDIVQSLNEEDRPQGSKVLRPEVVA
jgi:hypothetical protein